MTDALVMSFTGLSADHHRIPMHQLGKSLVATDRIVNSGLIFFAYGRPPRRGERFDFQVNAEQPKAGSVEIATVLQQVPWLLPVVQDFLVAGGVEAAFRFMSYVMNYFGGRRAEADTHLSALLQMNRDHLEARNRSDEAWRQSFMRLVESLRPSAKLAVEPLGRSAETLALAGPKDQSATIDEPMADVIRSKESDEVGDMLNMKIRVDGVIHHTRQLKVYDPEGSDRFITAHIRDPLFDTVPNPYAKAAAEIGELEVLAKPIYRAGKLDRIYVMDLVQ